MSINFGRAKFGRFGRTKVRRSESSFFGNPKYYTYNDFSKKWLLYEGHRYDDEQIKNYSVNCESKKYSKVCFHEGLLDNKPFSSVHILDFKKESFITMTTGMEDNTYKCVIY